jgi:hypothetical protein
MKLILSYILIFANFLNRLLKKFNFKISKHSNFLEILKGNNLIFLNFILKKSSKKQIKLIEKFLKSIKIIDSGYELIRIGRNTDGGYLIPNILNQIDFCFSPGVGLSTFFEDHLAKFKIKSFLADGTVDYQGQHYFVKKNLNIFNDSKNIKLDSWISEKIKDKNNNRLILQMDIEGSELEVLNATNKAILDRFKCIIIEFHNFHEILNPIGLKIYSNVLNKILKTHHIVHVHPNNNSRILNINNKDIANIYEITFINKKITRYIKKINYNLPHKLDKKCNLDFSEIKCPKVFYK